MWWALRSTALLPEEYHSPWMGLMASLRCIYYPFSHISTSRSNTAAFWCLITKLADFQFVHYLVTRLLGSNRELKQTQAAPCDQTLYPLSEKQRSRNEKSEVKLNILFTLLALSLEETSSHHSHHILHPQHNRQSPSSGRDTLSFVENWKEAHMKPSSLCVALA